MENKSMQSEPLRSEPETLSQAINYLGYVLEKSQKVSNLSEETRDIFRGTIGDKVDSIGVMDKELTKPTQPTMIQSICRIAAKIESNLESSGNHISQIQSMLQ